MKKMYFRFLFLFALCVVKPSAVAAQVVNYADAVLGYSTQWSSPNWAAFQALGYPNTYPAFGDIITAWASSTGDSQREYLHLQFNNPMPIDSIWVYETYYGGAIDTIYVKNPGTMMWDIVYTGAVNPVTVSQIFKVGFPMTAYDVSEIRIAINSPAVPSYNEIDAVAIVNSTADLVNICAGDSALIYGSYEDVAGVYDDSVIADADIFYTTLTVSNPTTSTISPSACDSYVSPSGLYTWTSSNTYMDTIPNTSGCDSVITVNLTINTVDAGAAITGPETLSANVAGASYQWLDCDNAYAIIAGETSQNFVTATDGNYAVEVTDNGCTDTSACLLLEYWSVPENAASVLFSAYPNPTDNNVTISFNTTQQDIVIIVTNPLGQVVSNTFYDQVFQCSLGLTDIPGIYVVEVRSDDKTLGFVKVIKN